MRGIVVFSGSSHKDLSKCIAARLGLPLGSLELSKFANLEIGVEIGQSVREKDVFIIQSPFGEVNDFLMELMVLVHACKIASTARVTVVLPWFPYSRHILCPENRPLRQPLSERQQQLLSRFQCPGRIIDGYKFWTAPSGRLVASMIQESGKGIFFHAELDQGFFRVPVDNLPAAPLLIKYIRENIPNYQEAIIVSPDAGGAKRAASFADRLNMEFALIHRSRCPVQKQETVTLVGNVSGKDVIMLDDMADTCVTLTEGASVLQRQGAKKIYAAITHGLFSGDSLSRIQDSPISEVIVSNTVPQSAACSKIRTFDVSPLLAEAIRRTHNGESISYLFSPDAFQ